MMGRNLGVYSREMLNPIYAQAKELWPLTETTLRGLHHELLKYHQPSAYYWGRYKLSPNRVVEKDHATGSERIVLDPTTPGSMTEAIELNCLSSLW